MVKQTHTLDMPVWNALYQVRNFATNVMNVKAQDASGGAAQVRNTKPSEWEITAPPGVWSATTFISIVPVHSVAN